MSDDSREMIRQFRIPLGVPPFVQRKAADLWERDLDAPCPDCGSRRHSEWQYPQNEPATMSEKRDWSARHRPFHLYMDENALLMEKMEAEIYRQQARIAELEAELASVRAAADRYCESHRNPQQASDDEGR